MHSLPPSPPQKADRTAASSFRKDFFGDSTELGAQDGAVFGKRASPCRSREWTAGNQIRQTPWVSFGQKSLRHAGVASDGPCNHIQACGICLNDEAGQSIKDTLMSVHVALLRGINVGGNKMVAMSAVRDLVSDLGFAGVKTILQSGNLVFESDGQTGDRLENLLERETSQRLGVSPDYVVRSASEWAKVVAANPFPKEVETDPSHVVVMFLKTAPPPKNVHALVASIQGPEIVRGRGKHLYIVYPDGIGTSKLTGALIERKLGARGTARNWNTVLKLLAVVGDKKMRRDRDI
jgi:uncharacterized protein (DUF1697 family)